MLDYRVEFDSPWYLLLLGLLPFLWWFSYRGLSGLGTARRMVVLLLRSAVLTLFVLALAEIQLVRVNERVTVIYLLDQSRSIPIEQRKRMIEFVNQAIAEHRQLEDKAGVIVFGREPAIEIPPFNDSVRVTPSIESLLDPDFTNMAGAMKLAQATFPEDAAKRVVIVSDGNENLGDALEQARGLAEAGIGMDVVPVRYRTRGEVIVEKVAIPADIRKGEPFDLRVVVNNITEATADDPGTVEGDLLIYRKTDDQPVLLNEGDTHVTLPPGKQVFNIQQSIDVPDFYTYEARFVPTNPADDSMPQNNRATTFTHIRGSGQVLLIEDHENRGEHAFLVDRLRANNLEVAIRSTDQLFTSLPELQQYDTVILANTPREAFSDEQIKMLVSNTEYMGSGLIMLGGENSFGAGGWANTDLEKALPLDCQIKSAKVVPKGALAMLMHASELAEGNFWQKVIAEEALKSLGNQDYCGVLHWDGNEKWLWNHPRGMVKVGGNRDKMLARISQMTPGDMPDFDPTMILARKEFAKLADAAVKHMIIISDGDPAPASRGVINGLVQNKVTVSTVAVGTHGPAGHGELKRIANATGGKYYVVKSNKALPKIFQREARRVARPLVYENQAGMTPQIVSFNEMLNGIDGGIPPITGYVMTTKKENPLVEVSLVSPLPEAGENNSLLASWTYGLGRSVAFTTDTGKRWSNAWAGWENYDKFFSQMVRWSMRPVGDQGKFTVATDIEDDKVRVVVTALDKDDRFLNFLDMAGTALGPDMQPRDVKIEQTAPGRYIGTFDAKDAGSYFLMISPGAGQAPIRTGVDVPYSAEFKDRFTDEALLAMLAELTPKGGKPGRIIEDASGRDDLDKLTETDSFRRDLPKATSSQDAWFLMCLFAGCLFLGDVFFRRVTVSLAWLWPILAKARDRLLGRESRPAPVEYMQRLRTRKAEVTEGLEQRRAATRFEPAPDAPPTATALEDQLLPPTGDPSKPPPPGAAGLSPEKEEESYTSRLLKAKKQVWDERK
jgi:uncharacterized membrane protein